MPSIVWGRDPQEAFEEPYEYCAQEQFVGEADALLRRLYGLLNSEDRLDENRSQSTRCFHA